MNDMTGSSSNATASALLTAWQSFAVGSKTSWFNATIALSSNQHFAPEYLRQALLLFKLKKRCSRDSMNDDSCGLT
jgi:hypothetical protein